jgi:hypothetical protein
MVAVSTLLPTELLLHICKELGTADLVALMRCGQLGHDMGDVELWRRLVHALSPFLQLFPTLLQDFFSLMEQTGLAILGDAVLNVLLFASQPDTTTPNEVQELHIAVNKKFFQNVIDFFKRAGYSGFEDAPCTDLEDAEPYAVMDRALGVMTSEKVHISMPPKSTLMFALTERT